MAPPPPSPFHGFSIAAAIGRSPHTERFLVRRSSGPSGNRPAAPPEFVLEAVLDPSRSHDIETRLSHLNAQPFWFIPYPVEFHLDAPRPFWLFNVLPGETLHQRITRSGPIPWLEAAPLLNAILDRLEAAERAGFVHGALDPHQIWLNPRGPEILGFITANKFPNLGSPASRQATRAMPSAQALASAESRGISLILHSILLGREPPSSPLRKSLPALANELLSTAAAPPHPQHSKIHELQSLLRKGPESQSSERTITLEPAKSPLTNSSSRASHNDLTGQQIGQLHILSKLGSGGMGTVYKARHVLLDKLFAVKVLRSNQDTTPEVSARFQREAQIAARLEHPNIVATVDFGVQDSLLYLVMRLVEGESLDVKMGRESPLPLLESLRIGLHIARGLDHAHQQQLIHRDIKPANILLSHTGEVLITDFGLARSVEKEEEAAMLTATGAIMGTPAYMSPEQCEGLKSIDGRTDIYSLGLILYELISGRRAARGDTPLQMIRTRLEQDLPPLSQLNPAVPNDVSFLVTSLLTRDPARRLWPTRELVARLEILHRNIETNAQAPAAAAPVGSPPLGSSRPAMPRRLARATGTIPAQTARLRASNSNQDAAVELSDSITEMLNNGQIAAAEDAIHQCPPELDGRWRDELKARLEKIIGIKDALGRRQESNPAKTVDTRELRNMASQLRDLCPKDPEALQTFQQLDEVLAFRDRLLNEARRARKESSFEEARAFLEEGIARLPADSELVAERGELEGAETRLREALDNALICEQRHDFLGALEHLQSAFVACPANESLRSRVSAMEALAAKQRQQKGRRKLAFLLGAPIASLIIAHFFATHSIQQLTETGLSAISRQDYSSSEQSIADAQIWLLIASPASKAQFAQFKERHEVLSAIDQIPRLERGDALGRLQALAPQDPQLLERLNAARKQLESDIAQAKALKSALEAPLPERSAALKTFTEKASGEFLARAEAELQRLADWRQRSESSARQAEKDHQWESALQFWNEARALGVSEAAAAIERIQKHQQWIEATHSQFQAAIKAKRWDEAKGLIAQLAARGEETKSLSNTLESLAPKSRDH